MKTSKCFIKWLLATCLIASGFCPISAAETNPRAQKLEAILAQLEEFLLLEPSGTDGMMGSLAISAANLRLVGDALPRMRTAEPLLVAYIEKRLLDSGFAKKVEPFLGSGLSEAGARLANAYQERESIILTLSGQPDQQRQAIALLNIPSQLDALEKKISEVIGSLGVLDPAVNPSWKQLFELLQGDLAQQIKIKTKDYTDEIEVGDAMRNAYWYAVKVPEVYETAYLQLTANREKLRDFSEVFFRALRPGTKPTQFLLGEIDRTLFAMKQMDVKVAEIVESLMQREDREVPLRGLDGLFNLRRSIRRQVDALRYGQQIYALHLLMDLTEAYKASNLWTNSGERSIWSGRGDFERVKLSYNKLREYGERWRKDPKTAPLCALIEIDSRGVPLSTLGGWLQWRWLGADDLSDFEDEGRIVSVGGRRWVVPPGVATKGITTMKELLALGNINELVTVLDLTKFVPSGALKQ